MDDLVENGFFDCTAIKSCAVYALVRKGEVVYVGKSKTTYARLGTHCRTRMRGVVKFTGLFERQMLSGVPFDEIWVRPCMLAELNRLEVEMIKKFRPKYNEKHKGGQEMPPEIRAMIERMSAVKEVEAETSPLFFNRRGL